MECVLVISVPADSTVTINGAETASTGGTRRFVSKGLTSGKSYAYTVRIVTAGDSPTEQVERLTLAAGEERLVSFNPAKAVAVSKAPSNDSVATTD